MYLDKKTQYSDFIEESLTYSIDNELILQSGLFGEYKLHRDSTERVFFPYNFIRQHLQ